MVDGINDAKELALKQEDWPRLPRQPKDPAIKPESPALQANSLPSELPGKP